MNKNTDGQTDKYTMNTSCLSLNKKLNEWNFKNKSFQNNWSRGRDTTYDRMK